MISSILISTDFSPASWKAIQFGAELARLNEDTQLSILHIYPSGKKEEENDLAFMPIDQVRSRMEELSKSLIDGPEERIKNVVLSGEVEKTILNFIHKNDFDLVIVGINSNGFDNVPGSHALQVIEKSGAPVIVVPNSTDNHGGSKS